MDPSEEIRQVVTRFFEASRDGDEEAVRNRVSRQPGFQRVGTDPDEVWQDGEAAARIWVQHMQDMGGGSFVVVLVRLPHFPPAAWDRSRSILRGRWGSALKTKMRSGMRISCVIVSYCNGRLLEDAITSVVGQSRAVDEIIVADDASPDGSRQLVEGLSRRYPIIKPIFRERNLGVSANRDLAIREARGDFITCLDGDDYFLPEKIEAEANALGQGHGVIAYSDVRWIDRRRNRVRTGTNAGFSGLRASERVRWVLTRSRQSPAALLVPKSAHLKVGGYNHNLRTYEDWDYMLRLAAQPLRWAHSGTEGLVAHPAGGLSTQSSLDHMGDELRVLSLNQEMIRRKVGLPLLLATAGSVVASGSKWWLVPRYRDTRRRLARCVRRYRGPTR